MKKYVALLRGISPLNAKMSELKSCFEKAGFKNVDAVLASGNIVFESPKMSEAALEKKIETAMMKHLKKSFHTIVRSIDDLKEMIESEPFGGFKLKKGSKEVVTFLRDKHKTKLSFPIEKGNARILKMTNREIFTSYVPTGKDAVFMVLIEKNFGKEITTRTIETVKKIIRKAEK